MIKEPRLIPMCYPKDLLQLHHITEKIFLIFDHFHQDNIQFYWNPVNNDEVNYLTKHNPTCHYHHFQIQLLRNHTAALPNSNLGQSDVVYNGVFHM